MHATYYHSTTHFTAKLISDIFRVARLCKNIKNISEIEPSCQYSELASNVDLQHCCNLVLPI